MKSLTVILLFFLLVPTWIASAELTKEEMKEIQEIMRQELQHVDKRFDDMNNSINARFDDVNKRIDDMNNRINARIDDVNNRINDVNNRIDNMTNLLLWGFGVLFAGMLALVGFITWDRRTALAPAVRKNKELEEK